MKENIVDFLDRSLQLGLIAFLFLFAAFAVYLTIRLKNRRPSVANHFRSGSDPGRKPDGKPYITAEARWRMAFHALLLALVASVFVFLVAGFTPLPFLENFATSSAWKTTPLRLTSLIQERDQSSFRLEGEVWNQSDEPISQLTAVIQILESGETVADEVAVEVTPRPLEPKSGGKFILEYPHDSPLLSGYRISFQGPNHRPIQHVTGLDVP